MNYSRGTIVDLRLSFSRPRWCMKVVYKKYACTADCEFDPNEW